jgi:hypothetical protein
MAMVVVLQGVLLVGARTGNARQVAMHLIHEALRVSQADLATRHQEGAMLRFDFRERTVIGQEVHDAIHAG